MTSTVVWRLFFCTKNDTIEKNELGKDMNITKYVDDNRIAPYTSANVFLRPNRMIVDANEQFYEYIGKNSVLPFDALVHPDDVKEFVDIVSGLEEGKSEYFITRVSNLAEGYRMVYMQARISNKMEDGNKLVQLVFYDIIDAANGFSAYRFNVRKYRHFLMLSNLLLFEYNTETEIFKIYKCMNDKSIMLVEENLDVWCDSIIDGVNVTVNVIEGINSFRETLKKGILSFELKMEEMGNKDSVCTIKGLPLRFFNEQHMSVGIIQSNFELKNSYYITPSARDAGTGLLNKKAIMEYIITQLQKKDDAAKWLIILDIDNFKDVNDEYGHLFGDRVIQRVADTILDVFGEYGVCGRFGGDEFLIFVEKLEDVESVKARIKAVTKHMMFAFSDEPENNIQITLSIGVVCYPKDGRNYQELFTKADKALYIAKDKGKKRFIIYDEEKHGNYEISNKKARNVAFSVSGEKRMGMLSEAVNNIALYGGKALESGELLHQLVEAFDLDGIIVYSARKRECIRISGNYAGNPNQDISDYLDMGYYKCYDSNGIYNDNTMAAISVRSPEAYQILKRMEIGSCLHCMTLKDGKPDVFVSFDIFNRGKKWSDTDVEEVSLIGKLICTVLSKED